MQFVGVIEQVLQDGSQAVQILDIEIRFPGQVE